MPGSVLCPRLARELLADKHTMKHRISRGTGSSNPAPSSKESANFRSLGRSIVELVRRPNGGRMEIVLRNGRRIVVDASVDSAALDRVINVLERR